MLYEKIKLEKEEKIITIVRKHWWVILVQILTVTFSALFPYIVFTIIITTEFFGAPVSPEVLTTFAPHITFFYAAWLLVNWMVLFNLWTDHYLDLWAVTTRRVVAIDQRGLFRRFISSFRLERLQDMNIEIHGIIPTLLNFGRIEAQTAGGSNEEFMTNNMPDPRGLKALIIKAADERIKALEADPIKSDSTL